MITNPSGTLRLFFALWPDDVTSSALLGLQASMCGRRIPYTNLHLTLVFLGQQPATLLPDLKDILNHLPRADICLVLDRVGYFPRKRIAWAGMHYTPDSLLALHCQLVQALQARNVVFNHQDDYKPHVTLSRDASLPPDLTFDPIIWRAHQAVLVQSTTTTEGSHYQVLASRSLNKDVWVPGSASNADH